MEGYYKTRIKVKPQLNRAETVCDYLMTTLYENVEFWGLSDTDQVYTNIGKWALNIEKNLSDDSFDVVMIFHDDNITEFWYVDEIGTIKKVFD